MIQGGNDLSDELMTDLLLRLESAESYSGRTIELTKDGSLLATVDIVAVKPGKMTPQEKLDQADDLIKELRYLLDRVCTRTVIGLIDDELIDRIDTACAE